MMQKFIEFFGDALRLFFDAADKLATGVAIAFVLFFLIGGVLSCAGWLGLL
jgi:hypothetical protein